MTTPEVKQEEWEKEFDNMTYGMNRPKMYGFENDFGEAQWDKVKLYIRSLLQAREKEVLEKMRDMFAKEAETTPDHGGMNRGFRAAAMMVSASLASLQALNEK